MSRVSRFDAKLTPNPIPLNRLTSIPCKIDKLSSAVFVGDPAIVEEVIFEPGSILEILSARTFSLFPSLKSITVPASVEVISSGCFAEMPLLDRIRFEAGSRLRVLESRAFSKCGSHWDEIKTRFDALVGKAGDFTVMAAQTEFRGFLNGLAGPPISSESICIPTSVETIGIECFAHSTFVGTVTFEAGSKLGQLGSRVFYQSLIQSIEIPSLVEVLPESCFRFCAILSSVTFTVDSKLRTIGQEAFAGSGIQSIRIPRRVKVIPTRCFERCSRLSSLEFEPGSKLFEIQFLAFYHCKMLGPSIHLPSSLAVVGANCFAGCQSLSVITAVPNRALAQMIGLSFSGGGLKLLCISASAIVVDWSWICRYAGTIGITFESPCRVREISNFNPGITAVFIWITDHPRNSEIEI
jgi:hypothetical protein